MKRLVQWCSENIRDIVYDRKWTQVLIPMVWYVNNLYECGTASWEARALWRAWSARIHGIGILYTHSSRSTLEFFLRLDDYFIHDDASCGA